MSIATLWQAPERGPAKRGGGAAGAGTNRLSVTQSNQIDDTVGVGRATSFAQHMRSEVVSGCSFGPAAVVAADCGLNPPPVARCTLSRP
eukprot:2734673-Prymnesium_polylepis.1